MSTLTSSLTYPEQSHLEAGRWNQWWFEPVSALNIGLCRLFFFALLFCNEASTPFGSWPTLPASYMNKIWLFQKLHLPILSPGMVYGLEYLWKASLLLACVGLFTRAATALSFLLGVYLVGLQYNYGKTDHMSAMFIFTFGIMALSRCGDAVSVDALIRRRRDPSPMPLSGEYRWPVRMVWVLMSVVFFAAGMTKFINGGPKWIFSENFALLLIQRHYMGDVPTLGWGLFIAKHPLLYEGFAASTMVIETFLFIALFSSRIRLVLPWMLLSMQIGIGLFMRVWFTPYMFVYLFWVPWDQIFLWLKGRRTTEAASV